MYVSTFLMKVKVAQTCLTLCDPVDCIVRGVLQARILEWVIISSSRGSSQPRDWTCISCLGRWVFFLSTEPPGKPHIYVYVSIYLYISHFKSDFLNTNDRKPIINNILLYRISTKVPCVHSVETYKESVFFPWSPLYCNSLRLFFFKMASRIFLHDT